jgi:hypothetical protein
LRHGLLLGEEAVDLDERVCEEGGADLLLLRWIVDAEQR